MTDQSNNKVLQIVASITRYSYFIDGIKDFWQEFKKTYFFNLGWQDVLARYRRSRVGPFWLTINMALILALAIIFGVLFQTPISSFLPNVAIYIIFWGFLSNALNESCDSFI